MEAPANTNPVLAYSVKRDATTGCYVVLGATGRLLATYKTFAGAQKFAARNMATTTRRINGYPVL